MKVSILEWTVLGLSGIVFAIGLAYWIWHRHQERVLKRLVEDVRLARWRLLKTIPSIRKNPYSPEVWVAYWSYEYELLRLELELRRKTGWPKLDPSDPRELGDELPEPPFGLGHLLGTRKQKQKR